MVPPQQAAPRRWVSSEAGQKFEPWQRSFYQQAGQMALGALKPLTQPDGFDFQSALETVGGPPGQFTDIPQSAYLAPSMLNQMENALFGDAAARTGAQQERIREGAIPGATSRFGLGEQLAAAQRFNDALAQRESTRLRGEYAPTINRQAAVAQTNVEAQRAGDDRDRRLLALTSQRDRTGQISALMAALAQFGQPLSSQQTYQPLYKVGYGSHPGLHVG